MRDAPKSVTVAGSDVVVAGPPGYCIDPSLSHSDGDISIVVLGSCAAISGQSDRIAPSAPAILTVTISARLDQSVPISLLEDYADSALGRVALSQSKDPSSIEILEALSEDGVVYVHLRDRGARVVRGASDRFWRALLPLNDRLVTASVVGLEAQPVSETEGFNTLLTLTDRLRQANSRIVISTSGAQRK